MDSIRRQVRASALRDLSVAVLAALALMFHFAAEPIAALRAGAIGFTFAALLMIVRIARTERQDVSRARYGTTFRPMNDRRRHRQPRNPPGRVAGLRALWLVCLRRVAGTLDAEIGGSLLTL